jgi:uncharacterized protein (UPF0335 family)
MTSIDPTIKAQIISFVERYERLETEKQTIAEDQKAVMSEAKAMGLQPKILKQVIKLRAKSKEDLTEEQELLKLYAAACNLQYGLDFTE